MIEASQVARILGISSEYIDLRQGVAALLPQHVVVVAQGASSYTYPTTKKLALSAALMANTYGPGSPIHGIYKKLRPDNGDGVGTVPITVIPLEDHESGVAAEGAVEIDAGSAAFNSECRVYAGGVPSAKFVIPKGTIDINYAHALMYDAMIATYDYPVIPGFTYGSVTETSRTGTGTGATSALSAAAPALPGDYKIRFVSEAADAGTFDFYYVKANGTEVKLNDTPQTLGAKTIGGVSFTIADGAQDFDIDDEITLRVPATEVTVVAKAAGAWTNGIVLSATSPEGSGITFTTTEMSGGAANPEVSTALTKIGNDWATMVINALEIEDTDALDAYQSWGESRWGETVHRPAIVFTGVTHAEVEDATAVCSTRKLDRINSQLVAPGSPDLPYLVAARQVARIAAVANDNPPTDYGGQVVADLTAGVEWDAPSRDAAVKLGSSTVELANGSLIISDVVTFWRPDGEEPPGYRHVVDIVRTQNIVFGLWLIFSQPQWAAAPLIKDNEPTTNPKARKRKDAAAAVSSMIDAYADAAIITDRDAAKKSISVTLGGPKRINVDLTTPYSGNTNIKDVRHKWGFVFS